MESKKIIWLTGATSGIGHSLALALIDQGHSLIVSGRRIETLLELKRRSPELVTVLRLDLLDPSSMNAIAKDLGDITDSLDTLILSAGACEYIDSPDEDDALYRRVLETNFFGQINCFLAALPLLRKSEHRAHVVGVGSMAAMLPFPRAQAYGASKAAFEYWLGCMRIDLRTEKIDVSVVSPGFVDTPLTRKNDFSMPALISVDQATQSILKGIEQRAMYIRFPWRLYWGLRMMSWMKNVWFRHVAPKLSREQAL